MQMIFCLFAGLFFGHFLSGDTAKSEFQIVNAHEHIESRQVAKAYQFAARSLGITHTLILGSPEAALVPGKQGFLMADENNREMLKLARDYPKQYSFFATIDAEDPEKLAKLKEYIRLGAKGLKLYSGHSAYYRKPLDESAMLPVFDFCEKENVPIVFHVNPALYQPQFESILSQYPRLKVVCPHYCLSTIRWNRFQELMDRYPNLYTDTSFGFIGFFKEALLRFSANPKLYRNLIVRYQDRILFGLDLTVNAEAYKNRGWLESMIKAYRDMLEKEEFTFIELPGKTLYGLSLDRVILRKLYFANYQRFMSKKSE